MCHRRGTFPPKPFCCSGSTCKTEGWTLQSYSKYRKNGAGAKSLTGVTTSVVQKETPFLGTELKSVGNVAVSGPKYFSAEAIPEGNFTAKSKWELCPKEREINVVSKDQNGISLGKVLVVER